MSATKDKSPMFDEACAFLIQLGTAAHDYGVSTYRLEVYLAKAAPALGVNGEFFVTPGYINFIFWRPGGTQQQSHFVRMAAPTFDMTKLAQVSELAAQVGTGALSMAEGTARLRVLKDQMPRYHAWFVALGYVLSGMGFAVLLSAGWSDVFLAGALSLVVYAVVQLAGRSRWLGKTLELSAALIASLLANALALLVPGSDPFIVTLCAVVILIPGLALTLGLAELVAKQVNSGMYRLIDGLLITIKLFVGAAIGTVLVNAVWTVPAASVAPAIAAGWTWGFVVALVVGLAVVFQVRPKDFGWTVLGGVLAFGGVKMGADLGYWQGSFIGALVLALYANLFAWWLGRPSSIVLLTAIMVLVPGAAAYRGLGTMASSGLMSGLAAEWQVFVNIAAILAGLLVAYTFMPPKSSL